MQLTTIIPWITINENGENRRSGFGAGTAARSGALSIGKKPVPQYSCNLAPSSARRGIVSPGKQLFVPIEVGFKLGETEIYPELGHAFVKDEPYEWVAGVEIKAVFGNGRVLCPSGA